VVTGGGYFQGSSEKPCFRITLHRWNIPPTTLRPGDSFAFELFVQNKLLSNKWNAHIGDGTGVRIDTNIGGPLWTNERAEKPVIISGQVNFTYPDNKTVKESVEWKIPNARQFKTLRITYSFWNMTAGRVWYDYEWQDNPQPKELEIRKPKPGEDSLETYVKPTPEQPPATTTSSSGGSGSGGGGSGGAPNTPATPTGFTVKIGKAKVKAGETVTLPIEVLKPTDVSSLNVEISFSPGVAVVKEKPVAGDLKGNRLFEANHGESGVVLVGLAGSAPLNSDGQLAVINFTAAGKPGEKTALTVKVTSANLSNGNPVTAATIDGELEIVESGGDVNDDNVVDSRDALDALKMSVRLLPVNLKADMDGNKVITANDARMILLKVVGK
jgi:hypothetical protein